jgi:hypothetical protein
VKKTLHATLVAALLLVGAAAVAPTPAAATTTYVVAVTADELDPNPGSNLPDLSLREAWQLASSDAGDTTIQLAPGATYELTRCGPADAQEDANVDGDLDGPIGADGNVLVVGEGATIVQRCPGERLVHHHDDTHLALVGTTLSGGQATLEGDEPIGGALLVGGAGSLHLDRVTVAGNDAGAGGGVASRGTDVVVEDSTFHGNVGVLGGGAIATLEGATSLRIERSTVSGNTSSFAGAAVYGSGVSSLLESTVVANRSDSGPSGLGGSGAWHSRGSVVAAGSGGPDCGVDDPISAAVANLDSDGTCFPATSLAGLHPQLGPLAANGGLALTHRPVVGSPLLDAVPVGQCLFPGDQRGEERPQPTGGSCDVGSVEEPADTCGPRFPDVGPGHPFADSICWLAQTEVTSGFSDGRFQPGSPVTRQSMAAFLYRFAMAPPFEAPAAASFTDVGLSHPFHHEVEWLAANEIAGGFADGTYRPSAPVTRQAMAAFLARVGNGATGAPEPAGPPSFSDVGAGHPFYAEVEWMDAASISKGYPDGSWHPADPVTRQAMSAFLHRLASVPNLAGI